MAIGRTELVADRRQLERLACCPHLIAAPAGLTMMLVNVCENGDINTAADRFALPIVDGNRERIVAGFVEK